MVNFQLIPFVKNGKIKKKRINQVRSEVTNTSPKTRDFVECNCLLHCNSSKIVDPRTFNNHMKELKWLWTIASESQSSSRSADTMSNPIYVKSPSGKKRKRKHRKKIEKLVLKKNKIHRIFHQILLLVMMMMNQLIYQRNENVMISFVMRFLIRMLNMSQF